jgi:hypothetical protein
MTLIRLFTNFVPSPLFYILIASPQYAHLPAMISSFRLAAFILSCVVMALSLASEVASRTEHVPLLNERADLKTCTELPVSHIKRLFVPALGWRQSATLIGSTENIQDHGFQLRGRRPVAGSIELFAPARQSQNNNQHVVRLRYIDLADRQRALPSRYFYLDDGDVCTVGRGRRVPTRKPYIAAAVIYTFEGSSS